MSKHHTSMSWRLRKQLSDRVRAEYGELCWLCSRQIADGEFSVDHVVPVSLGGDRYAIENARPAHRRCNSARGNRPATHRSSPQSRQW